MPNEINAPLTWQIRLVSAAAKAHGCEVVVRKVPRTIGGRITTKVDRLVRFVGKDSAVDKALSLTEGLFGDLNVRSDAFMRALPTGYTPTARKLARRAWLEKAAEAAAAKLTGGDSD